MVGASSREEHFPINEEANTEFKAKKRQVATSSVVYS